MNKVVKLYENGMTPIYWIEKQKDIDKGYKKYRDFKHMNTKVKFTALEDSMILNWTFDFSEISHWSDVVYFSFNFPYSFEDCLSLGTSL